MDSAALFRDMKASCEIVARLLKLEGLTHHPFETVAGISKLFAMKQALIDSDLRDILRTTVLGLIASAEQRVGGAPAGYQQSMATEALSNAKARVS